MKASRPYYAPSKEFNEFAFLGAGGGGWGLPCMHILFLLNLILIKLYFKTFVSLSRRFLKALVQCWECLPVACSPIYFQTNVSGGYYYTAQNTFPSTFLVLSRFAREITFLAFTSSRLIV